VLECGGHGRLEDEDEDAMAQFKIKICIPLFRCRTTKFPREVPPLPWYRTTIPQMAIAGFLPFSAIYVELYYIFASVWGHKVSCGSVLVSSFISS